jgi:hypothetical protein
MSVRSAIRGPAPTFAQRDRLPTAIEVVAGLAMCSSMLWPWTSAGLGSTLPAHRLADLALAGHASDLVTPWIGRLWLTAAVAGAAAVALAPFHQRGARRAMVVVVVVAWTATIGVLAALGGMPTHIGTGGVIAVAATAALTLTTGRKTNMWRNR